MSGFDDWFYQKEGNDEPRMVNLFDALFEEMMDNLENMLRLTYETGYNAGWSDREEVSRGLDS